MHFLFLHENVFEHDAIGRDLVAMYHALARRHPCRLFCRQRSENLQGLITCNRQEAEALLADPECVAIYHHSIHWKIGEEMLDKAAGQIVFKYHNITPPNYFPHSSVHWRACLAGREQTYRFAYRFPRALWASDSLFNLQELGMNRGVFGHVVPPYLGLNERDELAPDENLLRKLLSGQELHVLFVGRFAPNKGHLFLLDVVDAYRRSYGSIRAHLIGKRDENLENYYRTVLARIDELGLSDSVDLPDDVSQSALLSYYLGSDLFLCCSEHEGFCVPVVEAQALALPVIARAQSAVPETMGKRQILLGEDPRAYPPVMQKLRNDDVFRQSVVNRGRQNYETRFVNESIEKAFENALQDAGITL